MRRWLRRRRERVDRIEGRKSEAPIFIPSAGLRASSMLRSIVKSVAKSVQPTNPCA